MEDLSATDYRALGEIRYQIRRFLHFSEDAARAAGLESHQYQMLLAIKALAGGDDDDPTVGRLATHLLIRHHSAVGLLDRLQERGLITRVRANDGDRRQVSVRLTREGHTRLKNLATAHRGELLTFGPDLVRALQALLQRTNEPI
jgi:DNA-binding MarR family transcriptional regulator